MLADVDVQKPDEKSIMTYIAQFLKAYPEMGSDKPMVSTLFNLSFWVRKRLQGLLEKDQGATYNEAISNMCI